MPDPTDLPLHPPSDNTATPEAAAQPAAEATPAPMPEAAVQAAPEVHEAQAAGAPVDASDDDTDDTPATPAAPGAPALPQLNPAACAELLRQHFPALFAGPAKPFKLRIQQDIQQRAPGVFSKGSLSAFFRRHTGSTAYLIALSKATHRFDLDGQPAGELSDEHKQLAQAELVRRRALTREREQQAHAQQREQQREAQRAEMAQQAEANQARQARAALLRDFQRTTLTLANFCALKGMAPELLNPLLEQARKEAAEAPPMPQRPPFDERRGPGPRRDDRPGGRPDGRGGPAGGPNAGPNSAPGAPRPDARGPRRDDRRPPRPGGAAGPRGPRGPRGSGGAGDAGGSGGPGGPTGQS